MTSRKKERFKYKKKPFNSIGFILAFIVLISLFSETTRTIPVGSSEYFDDSFKTVPKLNLKTLEVKLLNNFSKFNEEPQYVYKDKTADDKMNSNRENIISKIVETYFALKEKMQNKETIVDEKKSLIDNQTAKNLKDLKLGYQYAKEQFSAGNINEGINIIEKLSRIYPGNIKIKLDLLAIYKEANLKNKAIVLIEEIKANENTTEENLKFVNKFESSLIDSNKKTLLSHMTNIITHQKKSSPNLVSYMEEISQLSESLFQRSIKNENVAKTIVSYGQILQNPKNLKLNYRYAKQQFKAGDINEGMATIKRMSKVYPDDIKIKLDLLAIYKRTNLFNEALALIDEIKDNKKITKKQLEIVNQIESSFNFVHSEPAKKKKPWMLSARVSFGINQDNNVSSVSSTRLQSSEDVISAFNDAKFDHTFTKGVGVTGFKFFGKNSSLMINANAGNADQDVGTGDYDSYGMTFALNTYLGSQSFAPYLMLSKYENKFSAEMLSYLLGLDITIPVTDRNDFSYGYSFSDTKYDQNSSYTSMANNNTKSNSFSLGHAFYKNEKISTSTSLTYTDSDVVVDAGNDYVSYELGLGLNFAYPWAYISIGNTLNFSDYKTVDTSINSNLKRSDAVNTVDISLSKALGDFFPSLDRKKNLTMNIAYEKNFSESNIINYDYISNSLSFGISKSLNLNKQ